MVDKIVIDSDELESIKNNLTYVGSEMERISNRAEEIQTEIGEPNPDFKHEIHEFDTSWDSHRKDIVEIVKAMHDVTEKFLKDWEDFDNQYGNALDKNLDAMQQGEVDAKAKKAGWKGAGAVKDALRQGAKHPYK